MKYLIPLIALMLLVVATKSMVATYHTSTATNAAASECINSYITTGIPRRDIVVNGPTCWVRK